MSDSIPDSPVADVGIFAGDIGVFHDEDQIFDFFVAMKERYEHIIYVLGNHEFYHMDYHATLIKAEQLAKDLGINVMDICLGTDNLELDGVKFWGSTLWTDFNNGDWYAKRAVGNGLNDFRVIKSNNRHFSVTECEAINKRTREAINWDADVIITHHAPLMVPNPNFPTTDTSYGFYNPGLEDKIAESDVKLMIYGHTHHSVDFDLNGTRIVANCHGYESRYAEFNNSEYRDDLIIEI